MSMASSTVLPLLMTASPISKKRSGRQSLRCLIHLKHQPLQPGSTLVLSHLRQDSIQNKHIISCQLVLCSPPAWTMAAFGYTGHQFQLAPSLPVDFDQASQTFHSGLRICPQCVTVWSFFPPM